MDNNSNTNMGESLPNQMTTPDETNTTVSVPQDDSTTIATQTESATAIEMPVTQESSLNTSEEGQQVAINQANSVAPEEVNPSFQPVTAAPTGSRVAILIVAGLVIIIGSLILLMWQGYIKMGGLEKYFQKTNNKGDNEIVVPDVQPQPTESQLRDTQRKSDLANIKTALKIYYSVKQSYPASNGVEKTSDEKTSLRQLIPNQLGTIPVDPLSPQYFYGYKSDGKTFELTCVLEDRNDTSGTMAGNYFIYKITESTADTPVVNPTLDQTNPSAAL